MLAEKPDLKFIPAQNIAHDEVIRAIVANRRGAARKRTALPDDDLMRVQQARKLHRHFFSATGRGLDFSRFRYVGCHGDAHAAEKKCRCSVRSEGTRLNSSHTVISYAVLRLKKQKTNEPRERQD